MECEGIKESLSAFLDGELTEEESSAVRAHLERCADCRKEIEAFRKMSALYRDLEDPEPPADLEERVLAEVGGLRIRRVPFWARFPSFPKPMLALAATVLVVCGAAAITARLIPSKGPMKLAKTESEEAASAVVSGGRVEDSELKSLAYLDRAKPKDLTKKEAPIERADAARGVPVRTEESKAIDVATDVPGADEQVMHQYYLKPKAGETVAVPYAEVGVGDALSDDRVGGDHVLGRRMRLARTSPTAEPKEELARRQVKQGVAGVEARRRVVGGTAVDADFFDQRAAEPIEKLAEDRPVAELGYRVMAERMPEEERQELHLRRVETPFREGVTTAALQSAPAPALEDRLVIAGRSAQPSARARAVPQAGVAGELSENLEPVVRANTGFALDMYAKLRDADSNLFFSPYSISTALAMTYGGAEANTASQMARTLHFGLNGERLHSGFAELEARLDEVQKKGDVQLYVANSLWPQEDYPFRGEYLSLMKKHYGVSITPVDYVKAHEEARRIINKWVEEQTNEKIKDIIRPNDLNPATVLVLVNAIYFKGNWASQFSADQTHTTEFTLPGGEKKNVAMMQQEGRFGYRDLEDAQVLELPYVGEQLSMFIVLPRETDGLRDLEDVLTEKNLRSWTSNLPRTTVRVFLPKFKVTWGTFGLKEPLQALGMRDAFVSGRADFSGMDGTKRLFIGRVLHKASIEVNEKGAEAAAATAVVMMRAPERTHTFRADHPFLLLICDKSTGSILFLGRIVDPSVE